VKFSRRHYGRLITQYLMLEPTRQILKNDIANRVNSACRYIIGLPNYRNVQIPCSPVQVLTLVDPCGYLPIHYAIASHNQYLFNLLVEIFSTFPAPLPYFNAADKAGNTPLHWAMIRMNYQAGVVLVRHGADVSRMNSQGRTPLHLVVSSCGSNSQSDLSAHRKMIKFLIAVGAKVDCFDMNNVTPLHIASELGDSFIIDILILEGGAFVNVVDDVGETPLFYALRGQHGDAVKKLVAYQASLSVKNDEGESPLEYCISNRDDHMVECLRRLSDFSVSPCNPNTGMSISGISLSGMSISDSSISTSSETSSMDLDLSRSQEIKKDIGEVTNNLKAISFQTRV